MANEISYWSLNHMLSKLPEKEQKHADKLLESLKTTLFNIQQVGDMSFIFILADDEITYVLNMLYSLFDPHRMREYFGTNAYTWYLRLMHPFQEMDRKNSGLTDLCD